MMHMKNFKVYTPLDSDLDKNLLAAKRSGGVFIKDDEGRDFYKSKDLFSENTLKVVYDAESNVVVIRESIDSTFPVGRSVIEIENQEYDDTRMYKVDTDRRALVINIQLENQSKKCALLDEADVVIQPMLGYALSGILSDKEKEKFKMWNEYRKELEGVDLGVEVIVWPNKPEV